eukprot:1692544-Amphidinium_carterae.1
MICCVVHATAQDDHILQVIRALEKLVETAVVTGTAVKRELLHRVTAPRPNSGTAKRKWTDSEGPALFDWSKSREYMSKHKPSLAAWLDKHQEYRQWFTKTRARVVATLLEACRGKTSLDADFADELDRLYCDVCTPDLQTCVLHSNINMQSNLERLINKKTLAYRLAESVIYGEARGFQTQEDLADCIFLGVGDETSRSGLEPLVVDCLKRIPA